MKRRYCTEACGCCSGRWEVLQLTAVASGAAIAQVKAAIELAPQLGWDEEGREKGSVGTELCELCTAVG
jgi:hypothetical protein